MAVCEEMAEQGRALTLLHADSEEDSVPTVWKRSRGAIVAAAAGIMAACLLAAASMASGHPAVVAASGAGGVVELALVTSKKIPRLTDAEKKRDRLPMVSHKNHSSNHSSNEEDMCSWGKANCNETKCCNNPGMQCFEQNSHYSQCREACTQGPDPSHWDSHKWACKVLGERSPGSSKCAAPGEDCSKSGCCQEANTQCFEKAPGWAACKSECRADSPDLTDADSHYWSCKKLGPWTDGAQAWVADACSGEGEDCMSTQCCKTPGAQCYMQNDGWAACKFDCVPGQDPERSWEPEWSCNEIGMRTPGTGPVKSDLVSKWVVDECSWAGSDCKGSRCCIGMNQQCYSKDENWAVCMEECTPGPHEDDDGEDWSCEELGSRSQGLALQGSPSLFCWSLFQASSYEMGVIQNQLTKGLGIFQCDGYVLLSTDEPMVVGKTLDGEEVESLHADFAEITTSVDGTAGNAALFINCWNVIVENGRWNNYAWTVKVDPDAVLLPERLRMHLAPHVLESVLVLNCNAFPSSPEFPMMYGSLEIFSWKAMKTYKDNLWLCMRDMAEYIPQWGEDRFMKKCMEHMGVGTIEDFNSVGDGVCTGVDCGNGFVAAFHPFKDVGGWQQCWDTAHR